MSGQEHLSENQLERLTLGLLAAERARDAQAHLEACEVCRGKLDALRENQARFEAGHDPKVFARRVLARAEQREPQRAPRFRWGWIAGMLAPAALAILVFFVRAPRRGDGYLEVKGGVRLELRTPQGPLREGAAVHPGDALRFVIGVPRPGFALIVGLDERGELFAYYPLQGESSAPVTASAAEVLPGSVVLDEKLGRERFYLLVTEKPLRVADVEAAVHAGRVTLAAPELPVHADQASILLDKIR